MKLMIIESPGKREKLSAILGEGWTVAASFGHIRDLPDKEMGVQAPDFVPRYVLTERGEATVAKLKILANKADEVYLATDPDREGESISWHLQQCLALRNPHRITFNAISAPVVQAALAAPRTIDAHLVAAQEARRVLDRLVGYTISPRLSDLTGQTLSAGRVQSPAVRLVVDREREIKAFRTTHHFGARLFFASAKNGGEWSAEWVTQPNFTSDEQPYFMDRAFAAAVSEVRQVAVQSFDERDARRSPPAPFITSTMQQAASVALGLDPKTTMEVAQKLFDQGHITYHRTDNPNIAAESLGEIRAVAERDGLAMAKTLRTFKAPAGAQVGHPAVTPTHWEIETAGASSDEQALYKLIRLRAIACQLADARYAVRTVTAEPIKGEGVLFVAKGKTLIDSGWLKLLDGDQTEEADATEPEADNPVPEVEPGQVLPVARGELLEKKTKAPRRYTKASLVGKLESEGIGRPATYAAIMDNISSRAYITTDKQFLAPTATGELIVDALAGRFEFIELAFTRQAEKDLDRIAQGEADYRAVIQRTFDQLNHELARLTATTAPKYACTACGKAMRQRKGKGKDSLFWGCTGYPECSVTLPDEGGKPGQRKAQLASEFPCGACGKPLVHKLKKGAKGWDFFGCSGYSEGCKAAYRNDNGKPVAV